MHGITNREQAWRSGDCTTSTHMARVQATSGLSWLLVLYSAPRGFSPGSPVFPSPKKSTSPNSNSTGCRTSHFRVSGASWINIDN